MYFLLSTLLILNYNHETCLRDVQFELVISAFHETYNYVHLLFLQCYMDCTQIFPFLMIIARNFKNIQPCIVNMCCSCGLHL